MSEAVAVPLGRRRQVKALNVRPGDYIEDLRGTVIVSEPYSDWLRHLEVGVPQPYSKHPFIVSFVLPFDSTIRVRRPSPKVDLT